MLISDETASEPSLIGGTGHSGQEIREAQMRPSTITTKYQQIRHSGRLAIAAGVVAAALVAPAAASASPAGLETSDYPGASQVSPQNVSSVTALAPPTSQPSSPVQHSESDYSSLTSITGSDGVGHAPVSVSSSSPSDDGFDWSDALIGAGIAALLAFCATGVALAGRRRTTLSPSA
jgi:hypothetical protein